MSLSYQNVADSVGGNLSTLKGNLSTKMDNLKDNSSDPAALVEAQQAMAEFEAALTATSQMMKALQNMNDAVIRNIPNTQSLHWVKALPKDRSI